VGATIIYSAVYSHQTYFGKPCKGTELFWPDLTVMQLTEEKPDIVIQLMEKPLIGQDKQIISSMILDISSQIANNFEGKEHLSLETDKGMF
jgi:hypothetical protein